MAGQPCNRCGGVGMCYCPVPVPVPAPASFTDSDVERVAEALAQEVADGVTGCSGGCTRRPCDVDHRAGERLARAALSAYLEPTTKGDT